MKEIILNEREYIENILNHPSKISNPNEIMGILALYYYQQGYRKQKICPLMERFILQWTSEANLVRWYKSIDFWVKRANKYPLVEIDYIPSTFDELTIVDALGVDLVEWYLKARLQQFEHVEIGIGEKIDHTMYLLNVRGKNYLGVHGDYDGSSGKVQALQSMVKKPLYAILSGHKHHNKIDVVQGIKTVMAGSFLGMDDFCVSQRIVGGPEQVVLVCDETGIVCSYDVGLSARKSF